MGCDCRASCVTDAERLTALYCASRTDFFMNEQWSLLYVNGDSDNVWPNKELHSYFTANSNARIRSLKYIHAVINILP
jgi:hypothetical protein